MEVAVRTRLLWGLLFVLLPTASHAFSCYGIGRDKGVIYPRYDVAILVNTSFTATCLFNDTLLRVEDVAFVNYNTKELLDSEIINSSAISIERRESEPVVYFLQCRHIPSSGGSESEICSREIRVGFPPLDVVDFRCISLDWKNLSCTWDIPRNYLHTTYNVTYSLYLDSSSEKRCNKSTETSCLVTFPPKRDKYFFKLYATNKIGSETFVREVDVAESVKPTKVAELGVVVLGPRKVNLNWNYPLTISTFSKLRYQIQYGIKGLDEWTVVSNVTTYDLWANGGLKNYSEVIDGLYPNTEYEFRLRLHTGYGQVRPDMWSEFEVIAATTFPTVPLTCPEVSDDAFLLLSSLSSSSIHIYWREVNHFKQGAGDFRVKVNVYEDGQHEPLYDQHKSVRLRDAEFYNMDPTKKYRFELIPTNSIGDASCSSEVVVNSREDILPGPLKFTVITYDRDEDTIFRCLWMPAERSHRIDSYTIFWCPQRDQSRKCSGKLEWKQMTNLEALPLDLSQFDLARSSSEYLEYNVTLPSRQIFHFGISARHKDKSSGIYWAGCIRSYNEAPPAPVLQASNSTSTSITVTWKLECASEASIPVLFNVSYCPVNSFTHHCDPSGIMHKVLSDFGAKDYVIHGLHPDTAYNITFAYISLAGPSKWSDIIHRRTLVSQPTGAPLNVSVVDATNTSVILWWEPPDMTVQNGVIIGYEVWLLGRSSHFTNATVYEHKNLEPFTKYIFHVSACTSAGCGSESASISAHTRPGVPDLVRFDMDHLDGRLTVDTSIDGCNGPSCSYEISYYINNTAHKKVFNKNVIQLSDDLEGFQCRNNTEVYLFVRAVGHDGDTLLEGPWTKKISPCILAGSRWLWWHLVLIVVGCVFVCALVVILLRRSFRSCVQARIEMTKDINVPVAKPDPILDKNFDFRRAEAERRTQMLEPGGGKRILPHPSPRKTSVSSEEEKLIEEGNGGGDFHAPPLPPMSTDNSSGCSSGAPSETPSPAVSQDGDSGIVRQRTLPSSPYVYADMMKSDYMKVGSVPNFCEPSEFSHDFKLPPCTTGYQRASTGYLSMDDSDVMTTSFIGPQQTQTQTQTQARHGLPVYSRHNFDPSLRTAAADAKHTSLPKLALGSPFAPEGVATLPEKQVVRPVSYVTAGDAPLKQDAAVFSLESVGLPSAAPPSPVPSCDKQSAPVPAVGKSPYVTCGQAQEMSKFQKQPNGYVTAAQGRWGHPVFHSDPRKVTSAPTGASKWQAVRPVRPSTSDATTHERPQDVAATPASSGYSSEDHMSAHEPFDLSPKRLIANSSKPYSSIFRSDQTVSMV